MTDIAATPRFPSPRLLRLWAAGTLALLFVLLTIGAFVTSFQAGMADTDWPTRPWHLAGVNWSDAGFGYLVEHSHRLAGFVVGGAVSLLALGLWWTEPRTAVRWAGLVALVGLLAAFGQLHGTLLTHQRVLKETGALTTPNWTTALGPTLAALAVVIPLALGAAATGPAGGGLRLLGVLLLVGVMAQGILGGMRVYLNALIGPELAAFHGVFSQVVLALAVTVVVLAGPRRDVPADDRWHPDAALVRCGVIAAAVVFVQIVAGAILRHTDSPLGPRAHLLGAFLVVFATGAAARRSRGAPGAARGLAVLAASLAGLQILLGIEAWMIRFKAGFAASRFQAITEAEAVVRTLHALTGYGLFAATVALAVVLFRNRDTAARPTARRPERRVEAVA